MKNLTFSSLYKIGIRAKNPNNISKESELVWKEFKTPSCVEWHNYNFSICAPFAPEGLKVDREYVGENTSSLNISWKQPQYFPDYYNLKIVDYNANIYCMNVSKELNKYFIPEITLSNPPCDVFLTAYTSGGNSTTGVSNKSNSVVVLINTNHYATKLTALIFCIVVVSVATFIIFHRRAKLKRYRERCKYLEEIEKEAATNQKAAFEFPTKNLLPSTTSEDLMLLQLDLEDKMHFNDAMEIDRDDIILYEVLGEGAFGLVRRALYHNDKRDAREVAVKTLKDRPSLDDVRAFRREIEVMKSVEKHPNIVGIIGHCTKNYNEMMLVTEYCSRGNLLDFLRNEWEYLYELSNKCNYSITLPNRIKISKRQHSTSQPKCNRSYNSSSSNNNSKTNNNNNGDATIINQFKLRYKSISTSPYKEPTINNMQGMTTVSHNKDDFATIPTIIAHALTTTSAGPTLTAADNKSYGYDEICTNACKCHVDVITIKDDDNLNQEKPQQLTTKTISIKNCECQHRLRIYNKIKKEAAAPPTGESFASAPAAIENRTYFKCLPDTAATRTQLNESVHQHEKEKMPLSSNNNLLADSVKREPLTASDMLDIAKQVAAGMEFLGKNKVVHRDLAARNVLVTSDRTIKIADFGLSRDIYEENIYKKTGNGMLPIKWLALESMTHQVYTTQSDVWSYGILLYEIVTLGETPYPTIPTNRLLNLLKIGYRMEKPKNCEQEFYNLMYSCWNANPTERPTFNEIIKIIDNLKLNGELKQNKNFSSNDVDVSYLKPLQ